MCIRDSLKLITTAIAKTDDVREIAELENGITSGIFPDHLKHLLERASDSETGMEYVAGQKKRKLHIGPQREPSEPPKAANESVRHPDPLRVNLKPKETYDFAVRRWRELNTYNPIAKSRPSEQ